MLRQRLIKGIDYAIESNFEAWEIPGRVRKSLINHKNICVYGLGRYFVDLQNKNFFKNFFGKDSIINYVCDMDVNKHGKMFETNIKSALCISYDELVKLDDVVVLVTVGDSRQIQEKLNGDHIENYLFGDLFLREYDPKYSSEWFETNRDKILQVYDMINEEKSKEIYTEVILNRIAPHLAKRIFNDMKEENEYYSTGIFKIVPEKEYIVECGAYTGDSLEEYMEMFDNKVGAYYCFELDNVNAQICQKVIERYQNDNVKLIKAGVSDRTEDIMIADSNGYSARVDGEGEKHNTAHIVRIDDVLADKPVTYIKMDIEGEEIKALIGAREVIEKQGPKLAISAYHFLSDMWEIPLLIKKMNEKYELYFRHHTAAVFDTDCYAVVKEA